MLNNLRKMLFGTGLAQISQFLSLFFLARLYSTEDFGYLALTQTFATWFVALSTLQLNSAIPVQHDIGRGLSCLRTGMSVNLFISLFLGLLALLLVSIDFSYVILTFVLGVNNLLSGYAVLLGKFSTFSKFYLARALAIVFLQLVLGAFKINSGLLYGLIIGELLSMFYFVACLKIRLSMERKMAVIWADLKELRSFTVYGTLQELLGVLAFYLPMLLVIGLHGESAGGQYSMANRLVWAPVGLIASSSVSVLYHNFMNFGVPEFSFLFPRQLFVLAVCIAAAAIFYFFPNFLTMFLGDKWEAINEFIILQIIWAAFFLISIPQRVKCRILRLQHLQLLVDLFVTVALVSWYATGYNPAVISTVAILCSVGCLQNVLLVVVIESRAARIC